MKNLLLGALLLLFSSTSTAQTRTDVLREREVLLSDGGAITFILESKGLPYFYVEEGKQIEAEVFFCRMPGMKGFFRRYWGAMASYLDNVASEAGTHPDSSWGYAWTTVGATASPGFCNLVVQTRQGHAYLTVKHVRQCFGSAGCNYDYAHFNVTTENLVELAATFREEAP